jgi:bifunctional non-homologous end joining protein LigD
MTVPTTRKRIPPLPKKPPGRTAQSAIKEILKQLPGALSKLLPVRLEPQLATLVRQAPEGDQWLSEIKFDGYRMICRVKRDQVGFSSRNHLDWTERLKHLATAVARLGLEDTILDGEVVTLETDGTTSFQSLQNAFREGRGDQLTYYVFDVLFLAGRDLRKLPLADRKGILSRLLTGQNGPIRYSEHVVGQAPEFFRQACKRRLEGIVCKRGDQPYRPGRGTDWVKVKCAHREEFVIGGYTPPAGSRRGFGALLVGYFNMRGQLVYAGRVGTGFSDRMLDELSKRLAKLGRQNSPFVDLQGVTGEARGVHWIAPRLVAQVAFSEWTRDGRLRHPAFLGLREDKPARQVHREQPVGVESLNNHDERPKKRAGKKS